MRRLFRWIGIALGGLIAAGVIGFAVVYVLSERILQRTYPVPAVAISIPTDGESIREGKRLATVNGCFNGCHGKQAGGNVMFDEAPVARLVAPDLTAAVRQYSPQQFAVAVRHGLRPDGRSLLVMPSESYSVMTDEELGRIIAFLKSLPPASGPGPGITLGPLGRLGLVTGKFKMAAQLTADAVRPPEARTEEGKVGRYVAQVACGHCHGTELKGDSNPEFTSPDLRVASAYSPEAFTTLLRTGVPVGGRKLGAMGDAARDNLLLLTDAEIAALYGYLRSLAGS
jgi:mono/diheme cytochrome c family protein